MENVIRLPMPKALRPSVARFGHYLRVGRNDHKEIATLLAEGERGYSGIVIDAHCARRHKELRVEAAKLGLEVILDPKSHAAAFEGGFTDSIGALPWIDGHQSTIQDFRGDAGFRRASQIAEYVLQEGFSAVLSPAHLIASASDPWLSIDVTVASHLRAALPADKAVFFPLALPMQVLRDPGSRKQIVSELRRLQVDGVWLRAENYGNDASGDKVRSYIECLAEFHELGIPLVADFVGGISALSPLAFGAVGGVAHGVMVFESFRASHWRKPSDGNARTPSHRIYMHELDLLLSPAQASSVLEHSTRLKGQHACRDPRCCPKGVRDMLQHPVRHYLIQRTREVGVINAVPASGRIQQLIDQFVRRRSDSMAALATAGLTDNALAVKIADRNKTLARMRTSLVSLAVEHPLSSASPMPLLPEHRLGRP